MFIYVVRTGVFSRNSRFLSHNIILFSVNPRERGDLDKILFGCIRRHPCGDDAYIYKYCVMTYYVLRT